MMSDEQYKLLWARRIAGNNLLWQTPALAAAAQAFLLSSAFQQRTSYVSLILPAVSFLVGLASVQLMTKHRYIEERDSALLAT
jgi:hypothetical protein